MLKTWLTILAGVAIPLALVAQASPDLVVENPWVRALPPTQPTTAAYMTLTNRGESDISVVGARADIAQTVEIHTTGKIDSYMRMEQLQSLRVAPGESLQLAPGGTHLMLLQLARMPVPGETVRLCLELASGGEVCTEAEVRKTAANQPTHDHHQHHEK